MEKRELAPFLENLAINMASGKERGELFLGLNHVEIQNANN